MIGKHGIRLPLTTKGEREANARLAEGARRGYLRPPSVADHACMGCSRALREGDELLCGKCGGRA